MTSESKISHVREYVRYWADLTGVKCVEVVSAADARTSHRRSALRLVSSSLPVKGSTTREVSPQGHCTL